MKENKILYDRKRPLTKCFDLRVHWNRARTLSDCLALCNVSFDHSLYLYLSICSLSMFPSCLTIYHNQRHCKYPLQLCVSRSRKTKPSGGTAYSYKKHLVSSYVITLQLLWLFLSVSLLGRPVKL